MKGGDYLKVEFKDRLKVAMKRSNMKAVDLCEKTGIPKSAVSYYLSGKSEPKNDRLYIIAKCLDVSEAWLLGYDVDIARSVEQKEIDEVAQVVDRIQKEKDFRQLIIKINHLKPEMLDIIKKLIEQLTL